MWLEGDERRHLIETAFRGGLAVALYAAFPPFSDIYRLWRRAAALVDWPDVFEYPPGAAVYIEPFLHLPSARWAVVANGVAMVLAAVIITHLLISSSDRAPRLDLRLWVASPALLVFLPVNWDVLVVLASVAGAVLFYNGRSFASGLTLGLGTILKIVPGALVLPYVVTTQGRRPRLQLLIGAGLVVSSAYAAYALFDPGWRFHLEFAAARSEIEFTLWGLLNGIAGLVGFDISVSAINAMSTGGLVLAVIGISAWAWWRRPGVGEIGALTMIAVLLFIKVFKPQYVLWALPFLAWVGASRGSVRVLEGTTLVQFATTYFALPVGLFSVLITPIRILVLALLARDLLVSREPKQAAGLVEGVS